MFKSMLEKPLSRSAFALFVILTGIAQYVTYLGTLFFEVPFATSLGLVSVFNVGFLILVYKRAIWMYGWHNVRFVTSSIPFILSWVLICIPSIITQIAGTFIWISMVLMYAIFTSISVKNLFSSLAISLATIVTLFFVM